MSEKTTPGASRQATDPSTSSTDTITEILRILRQIALRLDTLEHRFKYLDRDVLRAIGSPSKPVELDADEEDEAPPDTEEPPRIPGLARLSDGRTALAIVHLDAASLEGRETWTGIVLTEAETCDALDRLSDAADEAAGHVAGRILQNSKRREEEGEDE